MNKRAQILTDLAKASTLDEQRSLVAALEDLDRQAVTAAREDRDLDWADNVVRQTMSPVAVHEFHTAATEWFDEVDTSGSDYHPQIIAAAAQWHQRVSPEVKADAEEYATQAFAKMRREASRFGTSANDAFASAWEYLSFLRRREGASGLPQIDQTVAPDGVTEQATPLPADVFDTFGPEIHPINQGVSGTEDSNRAPLIQENVGGAGAGENLHSEAPVLTHPADGPTMALGHLMNLDEFRREAARQGGDPFARTAADGDSSQADDVHYPGNFGSSDQNGSAAMDRLVEATGLSAEEVRQRFPNPQEAVKVIDALGDSKKAAARKCRNCTNGNHSGTNGTPGCTGGSCGCTAANCGKNSGEGSGTGNPEKTGSIHTTAIFHEQYGEVSRPQLAAYRKHNISPSDHDDLVRHFGEGAHADITKWVKDQAAENNGRVDTFRLGRQAWNDPYGDFGHGASKKAAGDPDAWLDDLCPTCDGSGRIDANASDARIHEIKRATCPDCGGSGQKTASRKEGASTLDQIQQTTAPDGVTQRPTPLPAEVAFPLIDDTEMSSEQLVDSDPRAAVEKAAAMDDHANTCRGCGENLSRATASKTPSGESLYTCSSCGTKNYLQRAASKSFTPNDAMAHPEFFKGYGFARNWRTGSRLVRLGGAEFEAGLYAGISDNVEHQAAWVQAHRVQAAKQPEFAERIAVHDLFTSKVAAAKSLRVQGSYVLASTETDLVTTSPGTSPSPVGDTPINGPGRPGPLAGYDDPAAAGGPAPYNGAEPLGRSVVPGSISPAPIVAPEVSHGAPPNPLASQQTVAFRRRVQASLVAMANREG